MSARHLARSSWIAIAAVSLIARSARADAVVAEPVAAVVVAFPDDAPRVEVQIVLQLVLDAQGNVESAVETSRAPSSAPDSFSVAAVRAVKAVRFKARLHDDHPVRGRAEYVVVFHPPASPRSAPLPLPLPAANPDPASAAPQEVRVRGLAWPSSRGIGDLRMTREVFTAAPHEQTSEMLSAAPGFFVDHEDGEGIGNDVYLRGFDLDHGSGIEMRLGSIPINIPHHVQGQGYADANFIIPEVVRAIRVMQGPYDPRQGDAAIVGSAEFDLGVAERGYSAKATYGSFNQLRLLGIAAPKEANQETFLAFAVRQTDGFGQNRAGQSASVNAQYGVDLGVADHLRLIATAYGARFALPGVVRQDDVDAGRIGYDGSYPFFAQNQSVQSARVIVGAEFSHAPTSGARFEIAPWVMWTDYRSRQNYTGDLESSQINPTVSGLGDLFETTNLETAGGVTARARMEPVRVGAVAELVLEPGVYARVGHTNQTKSLLDPTSLSAWDRRIDAGLDTLDLGAYADLDLRLWKKLRVSGGVRADLLAESINDHLANVVPAGSSPPGALPGAIRDVSGIAAGPRVTAAYEPTPAFSAQLSYGEGFRSLDATTLTESRTPYSKVRSVEVGMRAQGFDKRITTTLALFETWVENELVFEAPAGGFETENASTRSGVVASLLAKPTPWLLISSAASVTNAVFTTQVPGVSHYVPNVPPILLRLDATARGRLATIGATPLTGRVGVGYTFLSGRHLTDAVIGPTANVLNAHASLRYGSVEVGLDGYNLLALRYADDAEVYVSNWSFRPGQQLASVATHITAAPPLTLLATLSLYF